MSILKIPTELRASIYGYVFEEHWEKHGRHVRVDSPPGCRMSDPEHIWDAVELQRASGPSRTKGNKRNSEYSRLDPPVLHTCKLFYKEGHDEYRRFLKGKVGFGPAGPGARNRACIRLRRYKKCGAGYRLDGREPWLYLRNLRFSR
ncbi:uncharacterized protein RHO25_007190 [Cercospora beticola]|uniref:Uncharacterized protein n=1 Tax=Cercospora beticola TaxID=122368 RepID=A0ABZ0NSY2_CERBT|nr:hypothetical protein RHO25_007190 [Cercospora beticola]